MRPAAIARLAGIRQRAVLAIRAASLYRKGRMRRWKGAMPQVSDNPGPKPVADAVADAPARNWVDVYAPAPARPYLQLMRADRPIGTWLLLIPCWQSLALAVAATGWRDHDLWLIAAFAIGAFVMRGAGCVLNDIVDRDFDAQVARTRSRPIPSGRVSVMQAVVFLAVLLAIGFAILLTMNLTSILLGVAALGPVAIYPFMKRFTYWPQVFLGVAFNWGALIGWVAHTGAFGWPAVALYASGIAWTLAYDTIYAYQDREDDALIGVKSTALRFGERPLPWMIGFSTAAVLLALLAVAAAGLGWPAWLGVAAFGGHLAWQIARLRIENPALCLRLFRSNRDAGLLLLAGLVLAAIV